MADSEGAERSRKRREAAEHRRQNQEQQRRRRGTRRLTLIGAASAVAVAVVAGVGWSIASREGDDGHGTGSAVEGFTHIHGVTLPGWASDGPFVATHDGLVEGGSDGGWRTVSEERHDFMGFTAHPTEEGRMFSSGHPAPGSSLVNPLGFMVSEDGGRTWETRALEGEVDFHTMSVGAGGDSVYGWSQGLYRSEDEGFTWDVVNAPDLAEAEGATALAAHPEDPDEVWAGTQVGLLRSTDGGGTWDPVLAAGPVSAVHLDPSDPAHVLAYSVTDGLLESRDAGEEWSELGWLLEEDAVGHLAISPEDPDLVYAGTFGAGVHRSEDGGSTWEALAREGRVVSD
ncbi:hypothetical protein KIK06_05825 [Nocardiopsis sp. EMB25]|uniref:F510_1955 family glycosylhydrolase n=1 Tax=Nocardiopsis sp. EMB25 TaxID=2835867 RepID=UPI002283D955|nr:hypothetical protein [Nocardiopsis sp. EMB25]MCY9783413.1 hypothetical protein [Nocardiopsis sp. EMB25]